MEGAHIFSIFVAVAVYMKLKTTLESEVKHGSTLLVEVQGLRIISILLYVLCPVDSSFDSVKLWLFFILFLLHCFREKTFSIIQPAFVSIPIEARSFQVILKKGFLGIAFNHAILCLYDRLFFCFPGFAISTNLQLSRLRTHCHIVNSQHIFISYDCMTIPICFGPHFLYIEILQKVIPSLPPFPFH